MMIIKRNKKGDITFVTSMVLISIISFFIVFSYFVGMKNTISSDIQDVACRGVIFGNDVSKVPVLGVYLYEIKNKCKVDDIKVNNKDKDSTFRPIAEEMAKCWYRYGNGEKDFLSTWDTTGEWCFKCGSITFKNDEVHEIYEYSDLVDWMSKNEFKTANGSMPYLDYVNMAVVDDKTEFENPSISQALNDEFKDESDEFKRFYLDMYMANEEFLNTYKFKKINPNDEKIYVVYRFIRIEDDLFEDVFQFFSAYGAQTAVYGGYKFSKYAALNPVKSVQNVKDVVTDKDPVKKLAKGTLKALKKHKFAAAIIGMTSTGYAMTNENYVQYVDVVNQEQYSRTCGTQRYSED